MPFAMFFSRLPEVAERETRMIILSQRTAGLPPGEYSLLEMYCDEPGCDCRRVMFSVFVSASSSVEATVAYGWESSEFYARWMHDNDPRWIREMQGPILNFGSPQSHRALAILDLVRNVALRDKQYVERLKNHYRMFREMIDRTPGLLGRKKNKKKRRRGR